MKKLIALIVLMSGLAVTAQAETKILIVQRDKSKELDIKERQVATVVTWVGYATAYGPRGTLVIVSGDESIQIHANSSFIIKPIIVPGPARLIYKAVQGTSMIAVKIENNSTAGDGKNAPSVVSSNNVTVIPDSTEVATLVLEGSDDMVNWTVETLGEKPKANRKKFYRLRAKKD